MGPLAAQAAQALGERHRGQGFAPAVQGDGEAWPRQRREQRLHLGTLPLRVVGACPGAHWQIADRRQALDAPAIGDAQLLPGRALVPPGPEDDDLAAQITSGSPRCADASTGSSAWTAWDGGDHPWGSRGSGGSAAPAAM